jgi:hypothetical protein
MQKWSPGSLCWGRLRGQGQHQMGKQVLHLPVMNLDQSALACYVQGNLKQMSRRGLTYLLLSLDVIVLGCSLIVCVAKSI